MKISPFLLQNPIPYLSRSKIEYHLVYNPVTRSILLVDFDQTTYLQVPEVKQVK
jgi:hypothetical protein